jgi:hypothetical protein
LVAGCQPWFTPRTIHGCLWSKTGRKLCCDDDGAVSRCDRHDSTKLATQLQNSTESQYQIVNKTYPNHRNVDVRVWWRQQQQQQQQPHHPLTGSLPHCSHARCSSLPLNDAWRVWNYCSTLRCCVVNSVLAMWSPLLERTIRQQRLFERLHAPATSHSRLFQWISHLTSPPALPTRV